MAGIQMLAALGFLLVFQIDCKPAKMAFPYVGIVPNAKLAFRPINASEQHVPNCFDKDMIEYKTWSEVCVLDSDGDGRTNGAEVGDPECTFNGTDIGIPQDKPISNPGVCDSAKGEDVAFRCSLFDPVTCVERDDPNQKKPLV